MELGLLCTGDDDVEELSEMYGPQCWEGCDAGRAVTTTRTWP